MWMNPKYPNHRLFKAERALNRLLFCGCVKWAHEPGNGGSGSCSSILPLMAHAGAKDRERRES